MSTRMLNKSKPAEKKDPTFWKIKSGHATSICTHTCTHTQHSGCIDKHLDGSPYTVTRGSIIYFRIIWINWQGHVLSHQSITREVHKWMYEQWFCPQFQCVGWFSHITKKFSDTSWVSYHSAQVHHYLLGMITDPTGEGLGPARLPFPFHMPIPSPGC